MKLLKTTLLISALFIGLGIGFAQEDSNPEIKQSLVAEYQSGTPDEIAELQTTRIKSAIQLTDAQETNVFYLNKKVAEKIQVIQNNTEWDQARKNEFIKGNLLDRRKAMSTMLTAEQFNQFDELDY